MADELLRLEGIAAGYGKLQVLWDAALRVEEGETLVLLGPNGAGKTTLLKTVIGLLPCWRGRLLWRGDEIGGLRTDRRVRAGIAYMSEIGCFPALSVDENIRIGGQFLPRRELAARRDELYQRFPALAPRRSALAGSLSGGQRKMLGIAKALAGKPRLLIMDEPSAGLSPRLVGEVIDLLRDLAGHGLSLLIAEQNVNFLALASRVATLEGGHVRFEGSVAALKADDGLRRTYFGLT
jgi:branched-chain amino acid transport system ATP-binding protein